MPNTKKRLFCKAARNSSVTKAARVRLPLAMCQGSQEHNYQPCANNHLIKCKMQQLKQKCSSHHERNFRYNRQCDALAFSWMRPMKIFTVMSKQKKKQEKEVKIKTKKNKKK